MKTLLSSMALGAIGFANNDIKIATRMVEQYRKRPTDNRIGVKFATRRLEEARQQLRAAIILLENDNEST